MSRSVKKGPFVNEALMKRIVEMNNTGKKAVTEDMVGHKLGERAPTRTYRGHAGEKATGKK